MRTVIVISKSEKQLELFTTLTKACKHNSLFNYGYLKDLKFPFKYKGYYFQKIELL